MRWKVATTESKEVALLIVIVSLSPRIFGQALYGVSVSPCHQDRPGERNEVLTNFDQSVGHTIGPDCFSKRTVRSIFFFTDRKEKSWSGGAVFRLPLNSTLGLGFTVWRFGSWSFGRSQFYCSTVGANPQIASWDRSIRSTGPRELSYILFVTDLHAHMLERWSAEKFYSGCQSYQGLILGWSDAGGTGLFWSIGPQTPETLNRQKMKA